MDVLSRKIKSPGLPEAILAYVKSWEMRGSDEVMIGSGVLDVLRAYLGKRPCAVWKKGASSLAKISERGVVEANSSSLNRAVVSGSPEFEAASLSSITLELNENFDGYLHIPLKAQEEVIGLMSLAVKKKESRDHAFVEGLACMARLVAISLQESQKQDQNSNRENRLRSEVEATTKELEHTNKRLIERVQELKVLSAELEDKVKDLTHANKAKDEFLSIVSHELRTPLTSLNGFLAVVLDGEAGPLTDEQKKFLTISKQSSDRLNLLIGDLLDISRIEAGRMNFDMESFSLFEILRKCVEGLKKSAEIKKINVQFNSVPTIPEVWGDPNRIQQVIDNLIMNALKFTEPEGRIEVWTEEKGDYVEVSIRDTGPGLAPEDQKKVFDMFYQVDASARRKAGGAGLGLSIAHGIVSLHGGQLWVESELGKGSIFKFVLPRTKERKAA